MSGQISRLMTYNAKAGPVSTRGYRACLHQEEILADRGFKKWQAKTDLAEQGTLFERLLQVRGLQETAVLEAFLHPDITQLHDPFLLPDMAKACDAILLALKTGQKIVVHGDYDADGLTSSALVSRFLLQLGANLQIIIPDRQGDGYGISANTVHNLIEAGCDLLITVDCGISSLAEVARLNAAGVVVVITDHHECGDDLPQALAVINPKRRDSNYPFNCLAGAGVAAKLLAALGQRLGRPDLWLDYIDLVALGTVADVVSLTGENRILVTAGLARLNQLSSGQANPGLAALISSSSQPGRVLTAQFLGFTLAPRLNAAGRMSSADLAMELLMTDDIMEAEQLALALADLNRQRQEIEEAITQEAISLIDSRPDLEKQSILVVAGQGWHSGVVGIVASRLVDLYSRPVIVLAQEGDIYKGSCRSYGDIDILQALTAASSTIERYGGHRKAAGLTVPLPNLASFTRLVEEYGATKIRPDQLSDLLLADLEVTSQDLNLANARQISQLEPFGEGNPVPLFIARSLLISEMKQVGNGRHLKMRLVDEENKVFWDSIAFGFADATQWTGPGSLVDVLFALEVNEWQGGSQVQLNVRDLQPADGRNQPAGQPAAMERAYKTHGSLEQISADYGVPLAQLLPAQAEYKAVYQYLSANISQQPDLHDLHLLSCKISYSYKMKLHPFRLARILAVFHEVGLIEQNYVGQGQLRLTMRQVANKVKLSDSATFRRLDQMKERGTQDE